MRTPRRSPCGEPNHEARVDAAAAEGPNRHVADQAQVVPNPPTGWSAAPSLARTESPVARREDAVTSTREIRTAPFRTIIVQQGRRLFTP